MEKGKMHFTKKTAIAIALLTVTVLAIGTLFVACDNNANDGATASQRGLIRHWVQ